MSNEERENSYFFGSTANWKDRAKESHSTSSFTILSEANMRLMIPLLTSTISFQDHTPLSCDFPGCADAKSSDPAAPYPQERTGPKGLPYSLSRPITTPATAFDINCFCDASEGN